MPLDLLPFFGRELFDFVAQVCLAAQLDGLHALRFEHAGEAPPVHRVDLVQRAARKAPQQVEVTQCSGRESAAVGWFGVVFFAGP